ncbi:MAG: ShlB/FhaC/HecB family hemolysin secretion/activation protein [Pseudomonadota bacterium]
MIPNNKHRIFTAMTLAGCLASSAAMAAPVNPGVAMKEVESTSPQRRLGQASGITMPTRPPMNAPAGAMQLDLKDFSITGNTVFSEQSLAHLVSEFVGKRNSFADLLRAANKITNFYRDAGYLVARAYVPEQEIQNGIVEIVVTEGRVGDVKVTNQSPANSGMVNRYIAGIQSGTVVSRDNVERTMLLLNDLPGVNAKATFSVGQQQGTTDLDVNLSAGPRISGAIDANNFGSDVTGQGRIGGSLYVNSLTGLGDMLGLRVLTSEDGGTVYGSIDYSLALGGRGTRMGIRYSTLDSDVGDTFSSLDLESSAETAGLFVTHPFKRGRYMNLIGQTSVERRTVDQEFGGALTGVSSEDSVNVFAVGMTGDYRDSIGSGGLSNFGLSLQFGLDDLGAKSSRIGGEGQFAKAELSYQRLQQLSDGMSLRLRFAGQFTDDPLVSSEQISLGGPNAVRAFVNGEGLADSGFILTGELQYQLPIRNTFLNSARLVGFYDFGTGQINDALPGVDDSFRREGVGIGLKVGVIGNYQLDLSYAHTASGKSTTDDDDGQFLIQAIKWFD